MNRLNSQSPTYTVKITIIPVDTEHRQPTQDDETHVQILFGLPLPHVGDSLELDGIVHTVKNRVLMLSNDVVRDALWNLLVDRNS